MSDFLENRDLAIDPLNITMVFDLIFLKDFDGNLVTRKNVGSLFDFPKSSLTFGFANDKATNNLAFLVFLFFGVLTFVGNKILTNTLSRCLLLWDQNLSTYILLVFLFRTVFHFKLL